MTDVFDVLRADHDTVKGILDRLESGPSMASAATGDQLAARKQLVDELIANQARHEAAEQQHFWPAVRALGSDGTRVADQAAEQETASEQAMGKLSLLAPEDHQFELVLTEFSSAARAHIAFEEAHAWPLLGASLTPQQSAGLAGGIIEARETAPSRPQSAAMPRSCGQEPAGPLATAADKLRDALTGRDRNA
jgi:hypothetical protein